jgi:F-type H+-transporting ATPase subunit b
MQIFEIFNIEWRVLLLNAVTFFIFLLILKKLLYKPLLDVMEKRRKKIEKSIKEAKEIEVKFEKTDLLIDKKIAKAKKEASEIIELAKKQGEEEKESLKQEGVKQARDLKEKVNKEIEEAKAGLISEARKEIADLILQLSEKVIQRNLSNEDKSKLEADLIESFKKK